MSLMINDVNDYFSPLSLILFESVIVYFVLTLIILIHSIMK